MSVDSSSPVDSANSDVTEDGGQTTSRDLTERIVGADDARALRRSGDLSSWVELGATSIPDWEAPQSRRSTRPEVAIASKNRRGRPRGSVLADKKSRRLDDGDSDIWLNALSNKVRQRVENFQAPHGHGIGLKIPRVTSLM